MLSRDNYLLNLINQSHKDQEKGMGRGLNHTLHQVKP